MPEATTSASRLCFCGCGRSIDHLRPQAKFYDGEVCRKRYDRAPDVQPIDWAVLTLDQVLTLIDLTAGERYLARITRCYAERDLVQLDRELDALYREKRKREIGIDGLRDFRSWSASSINITSAPKASRGTWRCGDRKRLQVPA
jgi:hypothetical protein